MNPLTKRLLALGASVTVAAAGGYLVAPWEGESNTSYQDIVGVYTICYGETKNVRPKEYRTDKQCEEGLAKELSKYNKEMKSYVNVPLTQHEEIAYTSLVWNIGITNFKNSTLLKKLNAGQKYEACSQILRWDYAGGKKVAGLTNRRQDEFKTCVGKRDDVNRALKELSEQGYVSLDIEGAQKD